MNCSIMKASEKPRLRGFPLLAANERPILRSLLAVPPPPTGAPTNQPLLTTTACYDPITVLTEELPVETRIRRHICWWKESDRSLLFCRHCHRKFLSQGCLACGKRQLASLASHLLPFHTTRLRTDYVSLTTLSPSITPLST